MSILITGSESFVGKELIKQIRNKNVNIIGIDLIKKEESEYKYYQVDINSNNLEEIISDEIEVIIHLAALSRDPDCKGRAYKCFESNVMGTLNLIEFAKKKNVKQFIFASSEWVYDEFKEGETKNEQFPINALSLTSEYALSKLTSEINLKQQFLNGFCSTTILRFGIIYGPRKNNWSAVEAIASQVKNNNTISVGSLKNGRKFIHVLDIVNGIIKSIGLKGFNTINLCGDSIITIKEIIEKCENMFDKKVEIIEKNPNEQNIRNPDNSRAKEILGWNQEIKLNEGLKNIEKFL